MSSGIAQLVVQGKQDQFISGNPEITFFNKLFSRHSNFSMWFDKQVVEGNVKPGNRQVVKITKGADMIGSVFIRLLNNNNLPTGYKFSDIIDRIELVIGGQVIDTQYGEYITVISPVVDYNSNRLMMGQGSNDIAQGYLPLSFFFNKDYGSMLPLVALQYHDVELRIYYTGYSDDRGQVIVASDRLKGDADGMSLECITQSFLLDNTERKIVAQKPTKMLITQVQRISSSNTSVQELQLHSPVKFIVGHFKNSDIYTNDSGVKNAWMNYSNRIKLQINGTDVTPWLYPYIDLGITTLLKHAPGRSLLFLDSVGVAKTHTVVNNSLERMFLLPFCLNVASLQPSGTINFSMIEDARVLSESPTYTFQGHLFAVNYNILRIENGMGGLMYI